MTSRSIPEGLEATRRALHQLAFFVLAPARYRVDERMGLKPTPGGFGTPPVAGRVLRVEGDLLISESEDGVATRTITTVGEAAAFFGVDYRVAWFEDFRDPLDPVPPDRRLEVDASASRFIGEVFALGDQVLTKLGDTLDEEFTEIQLWPEHFDLATETGDQEQGARASYGVSPGDHAHPDPYFYVSAWDEIDRADPFWNDREFNGASLGYRELAGSPDPLRATLDFLVTGHRSLHAG